MAFELPTDLIGKVQISLRNDAGLSDYDPNDPTLPALSSLEASIAGLDPSPPYLRCKHCKGRLLRGLQSVICIYCGKQQRNDMPPDPISFKSNFGYRWLLESLDLDGSEIVGPLTEGSELNRGQSAPKDEISLSDLLDLKLSWPVEPDIPETGPATIVTNKSLDQGRSSLNMTGVDLDNFFSGSKRDTVLSASEEQPVINKQIETAKSKTFTGQDNLSLFQSAQPSEITLRSPEVQSGDTFSGWEADFQSADSGNQHESSKSLDPSPTINSTFDLSAHMDSVFGPGKDFEDGKLKDDSDRPSLANDWNQDDLWNNVNSVVSRQADQLDATVKAKDGVTLDKLNNSSSMGVDWFQDDQWQTSITNAPNNRMTNEDVYSFGEWNDFTSSTSAQDPSRNTWKQNNDQIIEQASEINLFSSTSNFQDMDFGSFARPDLFSGSSSSQNGPAEINNILSEVSASDRISNSKSNVGGNTVQDGDVFNTTTQPEDAVEMLISQMHDLSFMLESNLSIPSKVDGLNSFSQD